MYNFQMKNGVNEVTATVYYKFTEFYLCIQDKGREFLKWDPPTLQKKRKYDSL